VELMGGEIGADSVPGHGSLFWFAIPFERQSDETHTPDWEGLSATRALAVDDNATNLTILAHYLKSWGLPHETARDGPEALERLRGAAAAGRPFDIALVDMQMPGLDGLALGRAIKSDPAIAETRLLLLSSIGQGDAGLREAGFLFALSKPIRQSILHDTLLRMHDLGTGVVRIDPDCPGDPDGRNLPHRVRPVPGERLKGRVLLAEDNLINQRVAIGMLTRLGVEVAVADDGAQALERALSEPFDLVLMDCEMPIMDGFEATRCLRERMPAGAGRPLPIVALTANAMAGDRDKCLAAGMDDYIPKPIKLEHLVRTLGRWLERAEPAGAPPAPRPPARAELSPTADTLERPRAIDCASLGVLGEGLARLLDRFEDRSSELVEVLAEAIGSGSPETLAQAARDLKGTAGHIGAGPLYELARQMEELGLGRHIDQAKSGLEALRIEHVRALAAVADLRAETQ
jgi:two-component system, sensor histidine kinase and response regulator